MEVGLGRPLGRQGLPCGTEVLTAGEQVDQEGCVLTGVAPGLEGADEGLEQGDGLGQGLGRVGGRRRASRRRRETRCATGKRHGSQGRQSRSGARRGCPSSRRSSCFVGPLWPHRKHDRGVYRSVLRSSRKPRSCRSNGVLSQPARIEATLSVLVVLSSRPIGPGRASARFPSCSCAGPCTSTRQPRPGSPGSHRRPKARESH